MIWILADVLILDSNIIFETHGTTVPTDSVYLGNKFSSSKGSFETHITVNNGDGKKSSAKQRWKKYQGQNTDINKECI